MASFVAEADDVIEGTAKGGIAGIVTYVVAGAVASLPGAFITPAVVDPLAVIAGALTFAGIVLANGRAKAASKASSSSAS